jgi:hypothetical protein
MAWKLDIAGYPRFDTTTVNNVIAGFYDATKVDVIKLNFVSMNFDIDSLFCFGVN